MVERIGAAKTQTRLGSKSINPYLFQTIQRTPNVLPDKGE